MDIPKGRFVVQDVITSFVPIPLDTHTLFADLLERVQNLEFQRVFGNLLGSFGKKTKDGVNYWYFRTSEGGHGRAEHYVGPDTEQTRQLIDQYRTLRPLAEETEDDIHRVASMLIVGGCAPTDPASARVIKALGASGLFRQGGVLVGTHAYVAIGNLLGVRWSGANKTQDIDFASFKIIEVAVPPMAEGVWKTVEALNMGFLPTSGLDPRTPSTSYAIRGQKLRVDLLTTASRTGPFDPVFIPRLGASAKPVPYMDYLLEDHVKGMIISGGATLVNVPFPARFGFHKILVSAERPVIEHAKSRKDLMQASQVLNHLLGVRPGDLDMAFDRLRKKGLHKKLVKIIQSQMAEDKLLLDFVNQRLV